MIRINLLPHREMRRERRKKDFIGLAVLVATVAAGLAFLVGVGINRQISAQDGRNSFIKAENDKLDGQIKEIANLRADIDALKARQGEDIVLACFAFEQCAFTEPGAGRQSGQRSELAFGRKQAHFGEAFHHTNPIFDRLTLAANKAAAGDVAHDDFALNLVQFVRR